MIIFNICWFSLHIPLDKFNLFVFFRLDARKIKYTDEGVHLKDALVCDTEIIPVSRFGCLSVCFESILFRLLLNVVSVSTCTL